MLAYSALEVRISQIINQLNLVACLVIFYWLSKLSSSCFIDYLLTINTMDGVPYFGNPTASIIHSLRNSRRLI